ncbi:MAG: hypothetical protein K2N01_02200 [Lachnospiraceae bacterium]|nr:hypothetical protein [Lachnospiraceae bacterium]
MSLYQKMAFLYGDMMAALRSFQAYGSFKKQQKSAVQGDKIRVGFMCQYLPAWGKLEPVYRLMKEASDFEVVLLCVPMGIHRQKLDDPEDIANDTYEYYKAQGYDAVNTLIGKDRWLDLETLKLDYLFFTRPYNSYMPPQYSSHEVSRYTKICVMLYAFTLMEETYRSTLNRDFFCNVYLYFAEDRYAMEKQIRAFSRRHRIGLQRSVYVGMAALADIYEAKGKHAGAWEFSGNEFRVMWTPRWTTDKALGGSNFFVYQKPLLAYADRHPDMDFLFRPHPLMFENFRKTGELTEQEEQEYRDRIAELPNVSLDESGAYAASFWKSSVLVSDISGMMPEYFVTGKPVVYCPTDSGLRLAESSVKLISGCYIAHNEAELFDILERLQRGEDPLREKRRALIPELFGEDIMGIPHRVLHIMREDGRLLPGKEAAGSKIGGNERT